MRFRASKPGWIIQTPSAAITGPNPDDPSGFGSAEPLAIFGLISEEKKGERGVILLQQNKRRRKPGKKCHARTVMHSKPVKLST
jgi:hypothetical protein